MAEKKYTAGIYLRLSKDDERAGESVSIENQRLLLTKHAKEQGWEIRDIYVDDGWSGTSLQRPAFQRMLLDARDGLINMVMVKDMSRLGRNHIEVGRLTDEVFPSLGIRFIAVNDRVDSLAGEDDMTAYRNLFNEFLSKDTSRKVRAVKRACMERGKYMGTYAPLGYKKDLTDRHKLVADEETAPIVRRIFEMRCQGKSYRSIAHILNEEDIPPPRTLHNRRAGKDRISGFSGVWSESTVSRILQNEIYIGHTVQGKFGTVSYKNHRVVSKPKEQWIRVENTHEPLIDRDKWDTVRLMHEQSYKPRKDAEGIQSMFSSLLKCGDCGFNLRANIDKGRHTDGSPYRYVGFMCSNYARNGKSACTVHTVYEKALAELVLHEIREHACKAAWDEKRITDQIRQTKIKENLTYLAAYRGELKSTEERLEAIDNVIQALYEDRVRGVITDSLFKNLVPKYEREREDKKNVAEALRKRVEKSERKWHDVEAWSSIIRQYFEPATLRQEVLLALVDRISVFEPERVGKQRICHIRIMYRWRVVEA